MVWFGLSTLTPGGGSTPTTIGGSSSTSSVPAAPTGVGAPEYAQCGGIGFTGPTSETTCFSLHSIPKLICMLLLGCAAPFTCKVANPYVRRFLC